MDSPSPAREAPRCGPFDRPRLRSLRAGRSALQAPEPCDTIPPLRAGKRRISGPGFLLEPADVTRIPAALGVAGEPVTQAGGCGGAGSAPPPRPSLFGAESERRMLPQDVKTAADAMKIVEERGISHVKVGVFDADGVMRGK